VAGLCNAARHERIAPEDVGEADQARDLLRLLVDEDVGGVGDRERDEARLRDFVQEMRLLAHTVPDAVVGHRHQHVLGVAEPGFQEREEGFSPRAAAFAGKYAVRQAELGGGEGGERADVRAQCSLYRLLLPGGQAGGQFGQPASWHVAHHQERDAQHASRAVVLEELWHRDRGEFVQRLQGLALRLQQLLLVPEQPDTVGRRAFEDQATAVCQPCEVDLVHASRQTFGLLEDDVGRPEHASDDSLDAGKVGRGRASP